MTTTEIEYSDSESVEPEVDDVRELDIPTVDWDEFLTRFRWEQGEHVTCVGPTGSGKTVLVKEIMHRRSHIAYIATKPKDVRVSELTDKRMPKDKRFARVARWEDKPPNVKRVILWPKFRTVNDTVKQQKVIASALGQIFVAGSWCVAVDEMSYCIQTLKLEPFFRIYWEQGRSLGLSLMCNTQRPRFIPLLAYSQATHLFFWRSNDEQDVARIGGLGAMSSRQIRETVERLPKFHVLYVNTRDNQMVVTKVPSERVTL